jgi:HD superfamily phosphodiesterase
MNFDEQKLIQVAQPYFKTARAGDWEHALRVVYWVKELAGNSADSYLLITAAYIHDIGWSGIAPHGKIDLEEMLKLEDKANANSSPLIIKVLTELEFNEEEIQIVNRLVAAADKHQSDTDDEAIIVDADSLSKLCVEHLSEKYQRESFAKVIHLWETNLPSRVKTEKGMKLFPELLKKLKQEVV